MNLNTYHITVTVVAPDRGLPTTMRNELQAAMDSLPKDMREAVTVGSVMDESMDEPAWHEALEKAVQEQTLTTRNTFDDPRREVKLLMLYMLERVLNIAKGTR